MTKYLTGFDPDNDPRGLMFEAFRMPELSEQECRTIMLDWALGLEGAFEYRTSILAILERYGDRHPDHPMTSLLEEGLAGATTPKRRRNRARSRPTDPAPEDI